MLCFGVQQRDGDGGWVGFLLSVSVCERESERQVGEVALACSLY